MSREPSNPLHRSWNYAPTPEPEPEPPKPKRVPRVRVVNSGRDKAIRKLLTSTEQLTADERQVLRGYRISRRDLGMEND